MRVLVIDASVVLKWLFNFPQEQDRDEAIELKNLHVSGKLKLHYPHYAIYEIANTLALSRYKLDKITIDESLKALESLKVIKDNDQNLLKQAIEIALTYNVSVYDSLYLALANKLKCDLVTADDKFTRKVKEGRFSIILLSNYPRTT